MNHKTAEQLDCLLTACVDAWQVDAGHSLDLIHLYGHWRGHADLLKFSQIPSAVAGSRPPNCVTMIEYARRIDADLGRRQWKLDHLEAQARRLLAMPHGVPACPQQTTTTGLPPGFGLACALSHTTLAICCWHNAEIDECAHHICQASQRFDRFLSVTEIPVEIPIEPRARVSGDARSLDPENAALTILQHAALVNADDWIPPSVTSWLSLFDLLSYMLGVDDRPAFTNSVKALTLDKERNGHVVRAQLRKVDAPVAGVYPDPRSFGITQLDNTIRRSIRQAWRCCQDTDLADRFALRLDIELDASPVQEITGASAGGLLAASMCATARERKLDECCTATCRLTFTRHQSIANEHDPMNPEDIVLGQIGGVVDKAREAWQVHHEIDEIFVCPADWKRWDAANRPGPVATEVRNLAELIDGLDRQRRNIEEIERYSAFQHNRWQSADAVDDSQTRSEGEHRLDLYVPPRLKIEGPRGRSSKLEGEPIRAEPDHDLPTECTVGGKGDQPLVNLLALALSNIALSSEELDETPSWLRGNRDILLHDNAGAGKSVCTLRMLHLLTDRSKWSTLRRDQQASLVLRLEGTWPQSDGRPLPLAQAVVEHMSTEVGYRSDAEKERVKQSVDYALRKSRIVVIIDGFDQLNDDLRQHVIQQRASIDGKRSRWIIASRAHTIKHLFDSDRAAEGWLRVRIESFSSEQQERYFRLAGIGDRWKEFVDLESMSDLLSLPLVLDHLREFIEKAEQQGVAARFDSLSQLALVVSRRMLDERALPQAKSAGVEPPADLTRADQLEVLEHVLSLMAFQMMLMGPSIGYNAKIIGRKQRIAYLEQCEDRFFWDLDAEESQLRLNEPGGYRRRLERLQETMTTRRSHWRWALKVLESIELSQRSQIEHYDENGIALRNRKTMECFAARYLTKYANAWDIHGNHEAAGHSPECASDFTIDPQWRETWILAIEMPQSPLPGRWDQVISGAVIDHLVTCETLSTLFRLPRDRARDANRPTELLYRCWHLFENDAQRLSDCHFRHAGKTMLGNDLARKIGEEALLDLGRKQLLGERVGCDKAIRLRDETLQRFRQTNRKLLGMIEARMGKVIVGENKRSEIPAETDCRKKMLDHWRQQEALEKSVTFLPCPPKSWIAACQERRDETDPCVQEAVANRSTHGIVPLLVQATTVTQSMYEWFDAGFSQRDPVAQWVSDTASPFDQSQDASSFPVIGTSWYDAWVFCKWLGPDFRLPTEAEWEHACRGGTQTEFHFGGGLNGEQANCDGSVPYGTEENGDALVPGPYLQRALPVGSPSYPCNNFGLFDMHGNVWEWCDTSVRQSARVLRGGAWDQLPVYCRSISSYFNSPVKRGPLVGFRVCRESA